METCISRTRLSGIVLALFAFLSASAASEIDALKASVRVVEGKLYDTRISPLWYSVTGEVRRVLPEGALIQRYHIQNIYGPNQGGNTLQRIGAYGGGNILLSPVIGTEKVFGKTILVQNIDPAKSPQAGQEIILMATPISTKQIGVSLFELWDCGRAPTDEELANGQAELEAQAKAIAEARAKQKASRDAEVKNKVLVFQKEQAAKGLALYQYELGLRYLKGDGVETNREEGLRWLKAAAAQDYDDAKKKLASLGVEFPFKDK